MSGVARPAFSGVSVQVFIIESGTFLPGRMHLTASHNVTGGIFFRRLAIV